MSPDPIVQEVRQAGERLAAEADNDVHRFFEMLRMAQAQYAEKLVREPIAREEASGRSTPSDLGMPRA